MDTQQPPRAALIVNPVTLDAAKNLKTILGMLDGAAQQGAKLALLGEMAATGMLNNDDPVHDLVLGQPIPGPVTDTLCTAAARLGIWIGCGLLERDGDHLYDTAVLISPAGRVHGKYRRMQPHWHSAQADPGVYRQGERLLKFEADFGLALFLICGDLYDEDLLAQARDLRPDWVLHPHARSFDDGSRDPRRWEREDLPDYERLASQVGAPVLAVGYLWADEYLEQADSYGGAMAFDREGRLVKNLPIGQAGVLMVDIKRF